MEGPLSLPQAFSTETSWTSRQGIWGSEGKRIVFLRRELDIPTNAEKVVLSATALDGTRSRQYVYNLYVNGTEIGLGPTRPNGKQLDYDTYDITDYVESGEKHYRCDCLFRKQLSFPLSNDSLFIGWLKTSDNKYGI